MTAKAHAKEEEWARVAQHQAARRLRSLRLEGGGGKGGRMCVRLRFSYLVLLFSIFELILWDGSVRGLEHVRLRILSLARWVYPFLSIALFSFSGVVVFLTLR